MTKDGFCLAPENKQAYNVSNSFVFDLGRFHMSDGGQLGGGGFFGGSAGPGGPFGVWPSLGCSSFFIILAGMLLVCGGCLRLVGQ
jgi:hypothetical protein